MLNIYFIYIYIYILSKVFCLINLLKHEKLNFMYISSNIEKITIKNINRLKFIKILKKTLKNDKINNNKYFEIVLLKKNYMI